MRVKIQVLDSGKAKDTKDRLALGIEIQSKFNDTFNVEKVDYLLEGDNAAEIEIPDSGRLVLNAPNAKEEDLVYDRAQGASVRRSQQENPSGLADAPKQPPKEEVKEKQETAPHTPTPTEGNAKVTLPPVQSGVVRRTVTTTPTTPQTPPKGVSPDAPVKGDEGKKEG